MPARRTALQCATTILPERVQHSVAGWFSRELKKQLCDCISEELLKALLRSMDLAFLICRGYRKNIRGFKGVCVLRTVKGRIDATAVFGGNHMKVEDQARTTYDVRVSFKDAHALWSFLLSENQDILDSILSNTVEVDGNLNYLYRFGFLAKDLTRRLGIQPA